MRKPHVFVVVFVTLGFMAGGARVAAQQSGTMFVPVNGTVDNGSAFGGTFVIQRFDTRSNGPVAVGTVSGVMTTANGTARNIVTQVAIPLSSPADVAAQAAQAAGSCGPVHLELGRTAFGVLGSVVTLNPNALDITSAQTVSSTAVFPANAAVVSPSTTTAIGPLGQPVAMPPTFAGLGTLTPGVVTPFQSSQPPSTGSSQQFAQALCSASAMAQTLANAGSLVPLLNQILASMGT